jgi:Flp pilus assembly protein TadG
MKDNLRARERGQTLLEFALVLMVLLMIILVIVDLSRAVFYYSVLHNAAREGARYGIVNPTAPDADIIAASQALTAGMNFKTAEVTRPADKTIVVKLEYTFTPATPVLSWLRGTSSLSDITLQAKTTMNIER